LVKLIKWVKWVKLVKLVKNDPFKEEHSKGTTSLFNRRRKEPASSSTRLEEVSWKRYQGRGWKVRKIKAKKTL
jgi:hypothetical protein